MLNRHSDRVVYIKIPKTGSTFFELHFDGKPIQIQRGVFKTIQSVGHSWSYPTEIRGWLQWMKRKVVDPNMYPVDTFNPGDFYSIITSVRNPFDILFSYFNYNWAICRRHHNLKLGEDYTKEDFQEFVDVYLDDSIPFHAPAFKKSMFSQLKDQNGKWLLDGKSIIFRFENIKDEMREFSIKMNIPLTNYSDLALRKPYSKKPCKWWEAYREDQVEKLNKLWEEDLNYFGYDYSDRF